MCVEINFVEKETDGNFLQKFVEKRGKPKISGEQLRWIEQALGTATKQNVIVNLNYEVWTVWR